MTYFYTYFKVQNHVLWDENMFKQALALWLLTMPLMMGKWMS